MCAGDAASPYPNVKWLRNRAAHETTDVKRVSGHPAQIPFAGEAVNQILILGLGRLVAVPLAVLAIVYFANNRKALVSGLSTT